MRYFLLLVVAASVGLSIRVTPPEYGWLHELVGPLACVAIVIGCWQCASLLRKLTLLAVALFVSWFSDWGWHALAHRPDDSLALRAGLFLLSIRAGVGVAALVPLHFAWRHRGLTIRCIERRPRVTVALVALCGRRR